MPEVQNVGAVDYSQYQPSQYPQETYSTDYNTQPDVYDDNYAQMQAANKSRIGATVLSAAIAVGIGVCGYFIGKGRGGKGDIDAVKKELEELKNSEAVKNYANLKKGLEELDEIADLNDRTLFGWMRNGNKFKQKFDEFMKPLKKASDEAKNTAENSAKKTADETKGAADDAAKKTSDEAKKES